MGRLFRAARGVTHGLISNLCTSAPRDSAISFPPMFAIAFRARQLLTSLLSSRSLRIELITSRINSEFSCISSVMARYPWSKRQA